MNGALRTKLLAVATAAAIAGAGAYSARQPDQPSTAVQLAMEIGAHYESGGRHIGTPYIDKIGKGQPWTVCNGVTGTGVVPGRYYSPDDCKRLELPIYQAAERDGQRLFFQWDSYNVWVKASFIDMIYNLGAPAVAGSSMRSLANAGNLPGACAQQPRWVLGTVNGQKVRMPGLEDRRGTTAELCADWGRDGHFSVAALEVPR